MCNAHATTVDIDWMVDNITYAQTTCEYGNDLNLPATPTKYGYVFRGWNKPTYLQLEYIESTGTQYIDTTYIPPFRDDTKTVHITTILERADDKTNWGYVVTNGNDDYPYSIYTYRSKTFQINYGYHGGDSDTNTIDTGLKTGKIKIETISQGRTYTVKANDTTIGTKTCGGNAPNITDNIRLFGSNRQYKLYGFSVAVDGVMMENLVPVQRSSDDAVGLYDTVTKTFFGNSGTGAFIAGPIVGGIAE